MSDSSNSNKYFVNSPQSNDYEGVNSDILEKASKFGTKTHRIVSAVGTNANRVDQGATNFKYLEDHLFSTKGIKSLGSIFDKNYIENVRALDGCTYKVLRFNRSHNIRTFDFIVTYTQVSEYASKVYKTIPVTAQYKGTLLFTGCSIVRDADTLEELPLKLYAKYESIGDTLNNSVDLDSITDAKGGPGITFVYTFDDDYVYLYIKTISPIRLIPVGDGEFRDISYIEGSGTLIGEQKADIKTVIDPINGTTKVEAFTPNTNLWCDITLSLKDTTIAHANDNAEFVDYDNKTLSVLATTLREQEFTLLPTNDGEQVVIGMEPASIVNMDIAPDIKPIRFGHDLLDTSMETVKEYTEKLRDKIIEAAANIEIVPFTIETTIRSRGKYNINTGTFIDGQADGFGDIVITDVGTYNNITAEFDITEYIFDKNQTKYTRLNTVRKYKDYKENASEYLTSITKDNPKFSNIRKTSNILDILTNINFETPNELDVYFNASFIKASTNFDVVEAYAEFGDDDDDNSDDYIVYICKDRKIRIVNFTDYSMDNLTVLDLTKFTDISTTDTITTVTRSETDDKYTYYIGTDNGLLIIASNLVSKTPEIVGYGAFDKQHYILENINYLNTDNLYVYIGGVNGNVSVYNIATDSMNYIESYFKAGDEIRAAKIINEENIVFVSEDEVCSYNLTSKKWNNENDTYHISVDYDNQYKGLPNPNIDAIIEREGFVDVPLIQKDIYLYALGLRYDTDKYTPVYKRLNLLTGETLDLPRPIDEESKVYKGSLCLDGDTIYCIGGTSVSHASDSIDQKIYTYISAFDTITNTWISLPKNKIELDGGVTFTSTNKIYPVAFNNTIYVIHPKATTVSKNENTSVWGSKESRITVSYKIAITSDDITVSELGDDVNELFSSDDITYIPTSILDGKIYFYAGTPDISGGKYNGYKILQVVLNTSDDTATSKSTTGCTETEVASEFSEDNYINAKSDLFNESSKITQSNESLIYCYDNFMVYIYNTENVLYTETHKIYHNITDSTFLPLISSGEHDAWKKYNKTDSSRTTLVRIKNYIIFINGNTSRASDYLSLDTMSLIPAPMFYERVSKITDSSTLGPHDDILKVIASDSLEYNELDECTVDNITYLLANVTVNSVHKFYILKYELDGPSKHVELVKDISDSVSESSVTNISLNTIPNQRKVLIVYKDSNGYTCNIYDIDTDTIISVFTGSDLFATAKIIYPIFTNSGNTAYLVSDKNVGYQITINGNSVSSTTAVSGLNLTNLDDVCSNSDPYVLKVANVGTHNIYVLPETDKEIIVDIDTSKSSISTKEIYTVPNSGKYAYANIFAKDNYIFFTKGKNGAILSNEIFRFDIDDIVYANVEVKHALLSTGSSENIAPFVVSRKNILYVFGLGRGYNSILKVLSSKIENDTFVAFNNELEISSSNLSSYNRFNPKMTSFTVNGNELLLVFGGTQSLATKTTTTVDVFDTKRHIWSPDSLTLPTTISHPSIMENKIVGATEEVLASASVSAYAKQLTIACTDYDNLKFSIGTLEYPKVNDFTYPNYASYAINKDETSLYIIPTLVTGILDNTKKAIYKIDIAKGTKTDCAALSDLEYIDELQVIGSFCHGENLCLALYSKTSNTVSIRYYNSTQNAWSTVTTINLTFTPTTNMQYSAANEFGFCLYKDTTNIINEDISENNVKAIITMLNKTTNAVDAILIKDLGDTVSVTKVHEYTKFMNGNIADVDETYVNSLGFTYLSDRVNNKIYRSFPNYDNNGFGIKALGINDDSDNVVCRIHRGNIVYSVYTDNTMSVIDLDKLTRSDIELNVSGTINPENATAKAFDNDILLYAKVTENDVESWNSFTITYNGSVTQVKQDVIPTTSRIMITGTDTDIVYTTSENDTNNITFSTFDSTNGLTEVYTVSTDETELIVPLSFVDGSIHVGVIKDSIITIEAITKDGIEVLNKIHIGLDNSAIILSDNYYNNTIFLLTSSGQVYRIDVDDLGNAIDVGYIFNTKLGTIGLTNNIIIRYTDIIDLNNGIKYTNPKIVNNDHYCFDNLSIAYNNSKIFTILKSVDSEENVTEHIETFDYDTHKLIQSVEVSQTFDINVSDVRFVFNSENSYKYCILTEGKLVIVDNNTGAVSIISDEKLNAKSGIIDVPNSDYILIGCTTDSLLALNKTDLIVSEKNVDLEDAPYHFDYLVSRSKFFTEFYCLGHKDNDTKYTLLKFDGTTYRLMNSVITNIDISSEYEIKNTNLGHALVNGSNAVLFDIDTNDDSTIILRYFDNWYLPEDSMNVNAYLDLNAELEKKFDVDLVYNNYRIYVDSSTLKMKNILTGKISTIGEVATGPILIRKFNGKVLLVFEDSDNSEYQFAVINTVDEAGVIFKTDKGEFDFSENNFGYADVPALHDSVIDNGIIRIGHIITSVNNQIRSVSFKVADPDNKISDFFDITDETVTLVYNDSDNESYESSAKPYRIFNTQNNYIGVLTDSKFILYNLSSAWKLSTTSVIIESQGSLFNSDFKVILVNDFIFIVNITNFACGVMLNPYNGTTYVIDSFDNICKSVSLERSFYNNLSLVDSNVIYCGNNRSSELGSNFDVFLDVVKYCSEYYNRYIGVDKTGEANSILSPLSEYTIDSVEVTSDEINTDTMRSVDNIKVILNLIYKTSSRNIIATIPAVSRLNSSKFVVKYNLSDADYIGEIYGFTSSEFNNTLVRYDSSYYDGNYSVVIANNRFIKINVDGEIYTYSISSNEVPLTNEILPIVIVYGDRTNSDGNVERRYLSFIDIKGNVVTYDKELKTFIDVSGYVDVDVPYFSSEAMIYPSKAIPLTDESEELISKDIVATEE